LHHIETIISKTSRMLGFIKRISREFRDPYTHKTLYTSLVKPNLEHSACIWSHLPVYDARCLLIRLEVLSDRRIVTSALFARDIFVGWVDCADLAFQLRFEKVPY
jgi:hypothetical protein